MDNKELLSFNSKRNVCQVGYASANVKDTIKMMRDVLGFGPWKIFTLTDFNSRHVKIYNKRIQEPFFVYVAHCDVGDTDIEVLAPAYGPNAYSTFIEEKGAGLQHPKEKVSKEDLWDWTLDAEEAGSELLLTGGIETDRFIYLDMQKQGAGIYELGNSPDGLDLEREDWPLDEDVEALRAENKKRTLTKITYLAYDYRRVMRALNFNLKMGPWKIAKLTEKDFDSLTIGGKKVEGPFSCMVATCMVGRYQMEIIQPLIGFENLFAYLDKHGEGPFRVTETMTAEEMAKFMARMQEKGYSVDMSGKLNGKNFACYNFESWGGSVYEVTDSDGVLDLEVPDEVWPEN